MAENKRDYYEILGISKSAGEADIKKAYRTLAKKYHPDQNPNDKTAETKFKEVNEAYEILSDSEKKSRYDAYGHAGVDPNANMGSGFGGFGGFGDFGRSGGMRVDVDDILSSFFGGFSQSSSSSRRNAPQRGEDIHQRIVISFEEAVFGCKKEVSYSRIETCADCSGSGAAKGTSAEMCGACNGLGVVKTQKRMGGFGVVESTSECGACRGTGKIIKSPCNTCRGSGLVRKSKKNTVEIPAGIDDGRGVRVGKEGDSGKNGGPAGDLIITVGVRPHPVFEREEYNLFCEIPITFADAALGAEIDVPTLEGSEKFKINEGTQTSSVFTLKNRGVQHVRNAKQRGDLHFRVVVEVPTGLSEKQKRALREFDESCGNKNHAKKESFFGKLKK